MLDLPSWVKKPPAQQPDPNHASTEQAMLPVESSQKVAEGQGTGSTDAQTDASGVYLYYEAEKRYEPFEGSQPQMIHNLREQLKAAEEALKFSKAQERTAVDLLEQNSLLSAQADRLIEELKANQSVAASANSEIVLLQAINAQLEMKMSDMDNANTKLAQERDKLEKQSAQFRSDQEEVVSKFTTTIEHLKFEIQQRNDRLHYLESSNEVVHLVSTIAERDSQIKDLECEMQAYKKIMDTLNISAGLPEELRQLRNTNNRLSKELEAAQDKLLELQNIASPLTSTPDVDVELQIPPALNIEIATALENEQYLVQLLQGELSKYKDAVYGDLSVDERVAALSNTNVELVANAVESARISQVLNAIILTMSSDLSQFKNCVILASDVFEQCLDSLKTALKNLQRDYLNLKAARRLPENFVEIMDATSFARVDQSCALLKRILVEIQEFQIKDDVQSYIDQVNSKAATQPGSVLLQNLEHTQAECRLKHIEAQNLEILLSQLRDLNMAKDESIQTKAEQIVFLQEQMTSLSVRMSEQRDENEKTNAEMRDLCQQAESLKDALVSRDQQVEQRDIEILNLRAELSAIQAKLSEQSAQAESQRAQASRLRELLEDATAQLEAAGEELRIERLKSNERTGTCEALSKELESVTGQIEQLKKQVLNEQAQHEQTIASLERTMTVQADELQQAIRGKTEVTEVLQSLQNQLESANFRAKDFANFINSQSVENMAESQDLEERGEEKDIALISFVQDAGRREIAKLRTRIRKLAESEALRAHEKAASAENMSAIQTQSEEHLAPDESNEITGRQKHRSEMERAIIAEPEVAIDNRLMEIQPVVSYMILTLSEIVDGLSIEVREIGEQVQPVYQLLREKTGEIKNLMSVMGTAHEDISKLHAQIQKDLKKIQDQEQAIEGFKEELSAVSSGHNKHVTELSSKLQEGQKQAEILAAKIQLMTELAEKERGAYEKEKNTLLEQIRQFAADYDLTRSKMVEAEQRVETMAKEAGFLESAKNAAVQELAEIRKQLEDCQKSMESQKSTDGQLEKMYAEKVQLELALTTQREEMLAQHEQQQEQIVSLSEELKRIAAHVSEMHGAPAVDKLNALSASSARIQSAPLVMGGDRMFLTGTTSASAPKTVTFDPAATATPPNLFQARARSGPDAETLSKPGGEGTDMQDFLV